MPAYGDGIKYGDRVCYGSYPLPARRAADVWQGFPGWFTGPASPLRDALGEGLRALWNRVASAAQKAALSTKRAHAAGWRLDLYGAGAGLARVRGEGDADYRARLGAVLDVATPNALWAMLLAVFGPLYPGAAAPPVALLEPRYDSAYGARATPGHATTRSAFYGRPLAYRPHHAGARVRAWGATAGRFVVVLPPRPAQGSAHARSGGVAGRSTFARPAGLAPPTLTSPPSYQGSARNFVTGANAARATAYAAAASSVERMRAAGVTARVVLGT